MDRRLLIVPLLLVCSGLVACSSRTQSRTTEASTSAKRSVAATATLKPLLARASQTDGASVSIQPSTAQVAAGQTVSVDVQAVSPSPGLGAWTIEIQYDPTVLSPTDCTAAPSVTEVCNPSYSANSVLLAGLSASGITGSQTLATLTFTALGAAGTSSTLTLVVDSFADPSGADIPTPATNNGLVNVVAPS